MSDLDLPDVNVLLALLTPNHVHHVVAQKWFAQTVRYATSPLTESGFLRLSMNPSVMGTAISAYDALNSLRSLREDDRAFFLEDGSSLVNPRIDLITLVGHKQVTDMHLINLAAYNNATLITLDSRIEQTLTSHDQHLVSVLRG